MFRNTKQISSLVTTYFKSMLKSGEVVRLFGLSNEHLNGALGKIQGDILSNGRYEVTLSSPETALQAHPNGISVRPCNLICTKECGNSSCGNEGKLVCSTCNRENYCCPDCQKKDWKVHKIMCKSMVDKPVTFEVVYNMSIKMLDYARSDKGIDFAEIAIRIMIHTLSFARHHFGDRIIGKSYHESVNGDRINNWRVEIEIIEKCSFAIGDRYEVLHTHGKLSLDSYRNVAFSYYQECLVILEPWRLQLDLQESDRVDHLNEVLIGHLFFLLSSREDVLGEINTKFVKFIIADGHCQRALAFAKRMTLGEKRTTCLFEALETFGCLRSCETRIKEARLIYEECYNLVAEEYHPTHSQVLEAAGHLIKNLCVEGEFVLAERYARVTYQSLTCPSNGHELEGSAVADGADRLSQCILYLLERGGPESVGFKIEEAEILARKASRITETIFGSFDERLSVKLANLANVLGFRGDIENEAIFLYERCLSIRTYIGGKDDPNLMELFNHMAMYYRKNARSMSLDKSKEEQLLKAKYYYRESYRICKKLYGPTHPDTIISRSQLDYFK